MSVMGAPLSAAISTSALRRSDADSSRFYGVDFVLPRGWCPSIVQPGRDIRPCSLTRSLTYCPMRFGLTRTTGGWTRPRGLAPFCGRPHAGSWSVRLSLSLTRQRGPDAFDVGRMVHVDVNAVLDWGTAGAGAARLARRWGSSRLIDLSESVLSALLADADLARASANASTAQATSVRTMRARRRDFALTMLGARLGTVPQSETRNLSTQNPSLLP